ncbi:protein-(glutamine-N5) methyltransferase, ribosomal protein L3-specific/protein-(glutamine-N5) methyltransferase, release factor-specific [Beggiatoa alba B18LD]|uniref:Ribosomal protein uL3 glutamine methyltransferase n=1 Tax=Beggiatoa alba B18LD TaxID=395493 RepID=I3CL40_9GAMM|nr:50S ribosomal protein L3 N(5)-glutamine methyltransferase [Beggiatoa alba]EIJ44333.1 protein-(glutamine-N5) methyltransferase, ribosomal protein L3-specific/protein-(glutamine-N5) methyltransferase, release factor-specific [Beggiatoa alba B18LD]
MDYPIDELHTPADFIRWSASRFNEAQLYFGHGTDNAIDEAIWLIMHTLHLPNNVPAFIWDTRLTYAEKSALFAVIEKRIDERIPTAYLTGMAWFAGLQFKVDPHVLIPRSPIAELINRHYEPWIKPENVHRVLDLCTGSGCIAIATALIAFPDAEVDAVDISPEALAIAQANIDGYDLQDRVYAVQSDLFSNLKGMRYDLIVSNPPYVDAEELANMPAEYHHEPRLGLEAGRDGLLFARKILKEAIHYLNPHGVLIVEVGVSQYALMEAYPDIPFMWLTFEASEDGVFLLTAEQLQEYAPYFA